MRKWLNVSLGLVMTVICSLTMVLPADAAELPGVSVPVTISLSGTLPYPAEDYTVVLKADDPAYPMPEGAVDGAYSLIITGEDTENFPTITYDRVGIYTYTVYQVAGTNQKCTYDDTVYSLTVTISNKEDYSGLEATAVLYPDSDGGKLPGAGFKNKYKVESSSQSSPDEEDEPEVYPYIPGTTTPTKTGDSANMALWTALLIAALAAGICIVGNHIKRRNSK